MSKTPDLYLNGARTAELWAAIKAALSTKADTTSLTAYATPESVATAITTALANHPNDAAVKAAISAALADYMTASQINDAIASAVADTANISFQAVDALPETGEANVIYLVPDEEDSNIRNQSMWINGAWVSLGSTEIDLSNYWSKDELRPMTAEELQAILV